MRHINFVKVCVTLKTDDPLPEINSALTTRFKKINNSASRQANPAHTEKAAYLLLMVGDDAADKVRMCLVEGLHQIGQLLLVELTNRTEHTLPRPLSTKLGGC